MQPAIKMALRVARQGADYLKAHFERQDIAGNTTEDRQRQLDRVTGNMFENFSEQLQKAYKDHYIAPAGDGNADGHALSWHIFPVIGGENLLRGIPDFVVALVQKKDGRTDNLLVINPVTGEEYSASRGRGAALNSRRMRVSETRHLSEAVVVSNLLDQARGAEEPLVWGELSAGLASQARQVRSTGCSVLDIARVAAGHLDVAILFRPSQEDLDIGLALANEAGVLSSDFSGNPSSGDTRQLAIANPKLIREVLRTLRPFQARLPR